MQRRPRSREMGAMAARVRCVSVPRTLLAGLLLSLAVALAGAAAAQPAGPPEIPVDSQPNSPKLPPGIYLGEVAGVTGSPKGHVVVFSRGNTTGPAYGAAAGQLLEFDHDGRFI